jgi:hypothetical protein
MRPRDWFLVGLRLIGVWVFYKGFTQLLGYGALMMNMGARIPGMPQYGPAQVYGEYYLLTVFGDLGFGLFLVFGCKRLAWRLFPDEWQQGDAERPPSAGDVDRLHRLVAEEMAQPPQARA